VCHPEGGLLDSLASRISVELIVVGSRFPRLLCSAWVMFSHCWFCPCHKGMKWVRNSCFVEKGSPTSKGRGQWSPGKPFAELSYTYLMNCLFNLWAHTADSHPTKGQTWGREGCSPAVSRALTARATVPTWRGSTITILMTARVFKLMFRCFLVPTLVGLLPMPHLVSL
jgi:hypothetical protein